MDAMASQITSLAIVYSTVYSDADQRKHQSSTSLAFVRGIHIQMASNAENVSIWWRHHDGRDHFQPLTPPCMHLYHLGQANALMTSCHGDSFCIQSTGNIAIIDGGAHKLSLKWRYIFLLKFGKFHTSIQSNHISDTHFLQYLFQRSHTRWKIPIWQINKCNCNQFRDINNRQHTNIISYLRVCVRGYGNLSIRSC